ncbi:MAG TPA: hypothetical protein VHN99_01045 [Deinococcales bacterium]|nr:hypothetical protein [Deinococcales bacterium]
MRQARAAVALLLLAAPLALAHEFASSGSVGGLLHLEPDDRVTAGAPAIAWVELTQRGGKAIAPADCSCAFTAKAAAGGRVIQGQVNPKPSGEAKGRPGAVFTFPAAGKWTVILTGKPKGQAKFPAFTLKWAETILPRPQGS